jgi:hypothetical protein
MCKRCGAKARTEPAARGQFSILAFQHDCLRDRVCIRCDDLSRWLIAHEPQNQPLVFVFYIHGYIIVTLHLWYELDLFLYSVLIMLVFIRAALSQSGTCKRVGSIDCIGDVICVDGLFPILK